MVTESYDYHEVEKTMMYYSTPLVKESDFPFNFYLLDLPQNNSGLWVKQLVDLWMVNMPRGQWANWVVSVHCHIPNFAHSWFLSCLCPPLQKKHWLTKLFQFIMLTSKPSVSFLLSTLVRLGTTTSLELPPLQVRPMLLLSICCCWPSRARPTPTTARSSAWRT